MKNGMFCGEIVEDDIKWMLDYGFDFAVGTDNDRFISICKKQNIEPWLCLGTFNPPSNKEEYLCLSINGERKEWFSSGCPNNPDIINYAIEKFEKTAEKEISGIFCDGIRFASPASGLEAFFTCFCKHCERKADEIGLDFDRMKKDVLALYNRCKTGFSFVPESISGIPSISFSYFLSMPGVCDWLWFRKKTITDFVEKISKIVKSKNKKFGGYLFSPCLCVFVGQDYTFLSPFIDVCSPMLYRNTGQKGSIAPVNTELETFAEWAKKENDPGWILRFTGLSSKIKSETEFLTKGISIQDIAKETSIAHRLLNKTTTLIPILWWKDKNIKRTIRKVIDSGACGIQIFWYTRETKSFIKKIFRDSG